MKLVGRDKNKECVIIDVLKDDYVMIDGKTRRKKCNIKHLIPLGKEVKLKTNASHDEVLNALMAEGITVEVKKTVQKKERKPKVEKIEVKTKKNAKSKK